MRWAFWLGLALYLIYAYHASAAEPWGLDLKEVSADYARFKDGSRDPVMYPDTPKERLDVNINMGVLRYVYMNNMIHSETDQSQFRVIGWKYQMGIHIGSWADLYAEHFSQHLLDTQGQTAYPVQNLIGLKLYIYRKDR